MAQWTWSTIKPCVLVIFEFFWGEATWGLTQGLRRLRVLRFIVLLTPFLSCVLVINAVVVNYHLTAFLEESRDSFSHYEGKILESQVKDLKEDFVDQRQVLSKLLEQTNTIQTLAVKQQVQIDELQKAFNDGRSVILQLIVAVIVIGGGGVLKDVLRIKFRSNRAQLARYATQLRKIDNNAAGDDD